MPKAKRNCGIQPKTISCPQCGKKFSSEINVLQHMNQPTGICYASSWMEDQRIDLYHLRPDGSDLDPQSHNVPDELHPKSALSPAGKPESDHHDQSQVPLSPLDFHSYEDPGIDEPGLGDIGMDVGSPEIDGEAQAKQTFTEVYQGCSQAFLGGSTFMGSFWQDKYAPERRENLYFPFASGDEWQFASWCLCSGLSMATVDLLLSLNVISQTLIPFCLELRPILKD